MLRYLGIAVLFSEEAWCCLARMLLLGDSLRGYGLFEGVEVVSALPRSKSRIIERIFHRVRP